MTTTRRGGTKKARGGRVSDDTLLQWLEDDPERLEQFLEANPEVADRLDALTELDAGVGQALEQAFAPTDDFATRMVEGLRIDPVTRETVGLLAAVFTLPWRTASFVVDPQPDESLVSQPDIAR